MFNKFCQWLGLNRGIGSDSSTNWATTTAYLGIVSEENKYAKNTLLVSFEK